MATLVGKAWGQDRLLPVVSVGDESRLTVADWKVKGNVASVVQPSLSLKEGLFFILKSNFILF